MAISSGEVGDQCSDEFEFDFDEVNLPDNHNTQLPPNQQIETPGGTGSNSSEYVDRDWELGSSSGSCNQLLVNQANINQNFTNYKPSSDSPLENAPDLSQPGTSSINPPLAASPQPYHPTTGYLELLGSSSGNYQPQLNRATSNANLSQPVYISFESSDNQAVNAPNLPQTGTSSFSPPLIGTPQPYPPTSLELNPQVGVVQSLNQEHDVNLIHPNHQPENVPQTEHMLPSRSQRLGSLNPCTTLCLDYFSNNNQQVSRYQTSFPQNATQVRVVNGSSSMVNQQRAASLPNIQNTPYRPLTQLGPQQLSEQRQHLNQVPMTPNVLDPQRYSMLSEPFRPQHLCYHHQLNQVVMPNVYDPQGCDSMLRPQLSLPSRPLQVHDNHQQLIQVRAAPNALNHQSHNSILPESSMLSRPQQLSYRPRLLNQATIAPNVFDQQRYNCIQPESFKLSRLQQLEGHPQQFNQISVTPNVYDLQRQNSMQPKPSMLSRSNDNEEQYCTHASNQFELGDSLLSSIYSKGGVIRPALIPPVSNPQSQGNEAQNFNVSSSSNPRRLRNSLYDPMFERIDLPVDPHIRMFVAKELIHANKRARQSDESSTSDI